MNWLIIIAIGIGIVLFVLWADVQADKKDNID